MKRILAVIVAAASVLALAACGLEPMSAEKMQEIAEARDVCNEAGGVFEQWNTEFGVNYRCDFDQTEYE